MKLARWVFLVSGIIGTLMVVPVVITLITEGRDVLPEIANSGLFSFVMVIQHIVWQGLIILLASDPLRFRPVMIVAFCAETLTPFNPIWQFFYGYIFWIYSIGIYLGFAFLFVLAFWATSRDLTSSLSEKSSHLL